MSEALGETNEEVKEQLLAIAKEMLTSGLVQGTAGNVAARLPDGNVVLTPSSLNYLTMGLDDLVVCNLDGEVVEGSSAIAWTGTATPGEYASERSRWVAIGLEAMISSLPGRMVLW